MALFIPSKIKVGFQERNDTFTGQLAYIIYYDERGKLRKETSWSSWRNDSIEAVEYDNTPQSNFVFNRSKQRDNYHFGSGRSVFRVYDQRGFEFEVSSENLVGLLALCDISKGDIADECVFAWAGTELILLPVESQEYKDAMNYTALQDKKIYVKDLVPGIVYNSRKRGTQCMYIGRYNYHESNYRGYHQHGHDINYGTRDNKGMRHVFYNIKTGKFDIPAVTSFATAETHLPSDDLEDIQQQYLESIHTVHLESIGYARIQGLSFDSMYDFLTKRKDSTETVYFNIMNDMIHLYHYSHYTPGSTDSEIIAKCNIYFGGKRRHSYGYGPSYNEMTKEAKRKLPSELSNPYIRVYKTINGVYWNDRTDQPVDIIEGSFKTAAEITNG